MHKTFHKKVISKNKQMTNSNKGNLLRNQKINLRKSKTNKKCFSFDTFFFYRIILFIYLVTIERGMTLFL